MSNEAKVVGRLSIIDTSTTTPLQYNGVGPGQFQADVTERKGPCPGALDIPEAGVDIDLTQLGTPGLGEVYNIGTAFTFMLGIKDPQTGQFYPFAEYKPGECFPIRLSRYVEWQFGTGTGSGTTTNKLHAKGMGGTAKAMFNFFGA